KGYLSLTFGIAMEMVTKRSGSRYARGFSRMPFTRLNIAVLPPMPRARVATATVVNAGVCARDRKVCRNTIQTSLLARHLSGQPNRPVRNAVKRSIWCSVSVFGNRCPVANRVGWLGVTVENMGELGLFCQKVRLLTRAVRCGALA